MLGSQLVCSSPRLIAAYHVLHRLPVPRHPPCALTRLISVSRCDSSDTTHTLVGCQRARRMLYVTHHTKCRATGDVPPVTETIELWSAGDSRGLSGRSMLRRYSA